MRKNLKLLIKLTIIALAIILNSRNCYASIEIIPSKDGTGKDSLVNTTISNSYLLCQKMKDKGEALGRTSVVPHLATNLDWGAVAYLSNSSYGTNTEGKNNGVQVTINDVNYYSTNGNATGVMNWGSNPNKTLYTQTAGILQTYNPDSASENLQSNVAAVYENRDTRFVNNLSDFNVNNIRGMAFTETGGWYGSRDGRGSNTNYPITFRIGLFGYFVGNYTSGAFNATGGAASNATFRPVIWNE